MGKEEITEEGYEIIADRNYELGIQAGMNRVAVFLLKRATSFWQKDRLKEAELLKNICREIEKEEKELRAKWDEKHKKYLKEE